MTTPQSYFKNPSSFTRALVHKSYCNEHPGTESNERLEFLGDSILSLIISERLYKLMPQAPEGELTARRSYIVQTGSLAKKAVSLGLDQALLLSHGEQESGGRTNLSLLANTFEAVLGSLFLDAGLEVCKSYLLAVFPDSEITADYEIKDPKSLLQEISQAKGLGTPTYRIVSTTGPDHAKEFVVEVLIGDNQKAEGSGTSKQRAEVEAAKTALMTFNSTSGKI